ncbi:50S ribosomal protein [Grosmannia clavigera kw1407]|uniref:Large ribosomal subunit protein bL27m n=1 Tax=Grosmannia clavigera (strain kw1407 / UAMH 11150) TaxID=655863 RepID=F0XNU4_GROCL|nr:50S ribosomal protein [Grosmannia clavigera kw1407]EFX00541.1 50S ribosomal protein [Grosmannia clavigera kw1407]
MIFPLSQAFATYERPNPKAYAMRLPKLQVSAMASLLSCALTRRVSPSIWSRNPSDVLSIVGGHRFAAVKAQGAYRLKNKKTLPKKLGAKRVGDQYVLPGTIIYKQRGTLWHAGENSILGRDHTIHSAIAGFVKYYRDPAKHPDRQYIGVTYDRNDTLPYSPQEARKRRLGMTAIPRKSSAAFEVLSKSGIPRRVIRKEGVLEMGGAVTAEDPTAAAVEAAEAAAEMADPSADGKKKATSKASRAARRWNAYVRTKRSSRMLYLGKNYSYQESNFQIGRLMGTHKGKTPGTQRYGSRRSILRHRRKKRDEQLRQVRGMERQERELALEKGRPRNNTGATKKFEGGKKPKKGKKMAK